MGQDKEDRLHADTAKGRMVKFEKNMIRHTIARL